VFLENNIANHLQPRRVIVRRNPQNRQLWCMLWEVKKIGSRKTTKIGINVAKSLSVDWGSSKIFVGIIFVSKHTVGASPFYTVFSKKW